MADRRSLVIAHRTCALDAPENSVEGIKLAPQLGADGVEFDVRLTRDGTPVLMHDAVPWRTTRTPWPVRWMSAQALTQLRFRRGDGHPPTLTDAIANVPAGLRLAFDIKDPRAMNACIDLVLGAEIGDRAMLWCRDPRAVELAGRRAPHVRRALLRDDLRRGGARKYLDDSAALHAHVVSVHERFVDCESVAYGQKLGLDVYAWVQSAATQPATLATGVDGVVTDWPKAARQWIDS